MKWLCSGTGELSNVSVCLSVLLLLVPFADAPSDQRRSHQKIRRRCAARSCPNSGLYPIWTFYWTLSSLNSSVRFLCRRGSRRNLFTGPLCPNILSPFCLVIRHRRGCVLPIQGVEPMRTACHLTYSYQWSRRSWRRVPAARGENKPTHAERTVRIKFLIKST